MAIHIGCGSWADDKYVGLFYPKGLPAGDRLRVYAQWFDRIELNNTYYNTPSPKSVAEWAAQTPAGFIFDFKLHRSFSRNPRHAGGSGEMGKLLADDAQLIAAGKLGAFLLTLPPSFGPDQDRLEELDGVIDGLPAFPLAVELRHWDWVRRDMLAKTLDYFRRRKLVWVAPDLPWLDSPTLCPAVDEVTNSHLAYLRLHGRNPNYLKAKTAAEKHQHDYAEKELEEIVGRIERLARHAKDVSRERQQSRRKLRAQGGSGIATLAGSESAGVQLDTPRNIFRGLGPRFA